MIEMSSEINLSPEFLGMNEGEPVTPEIQGIRAWLANQWNNTCRGARLLRTRMVNIPVGRVLRAFLPCAPRYRILTTAICFVIAVFFFNSLRCNPKGPTPTEIRLSTELAMKNLELEQIESKFRDCQEEKLNMWEHPSQNKPFTLTPEIMSLMNTISNPLVAAGLRTRSSSLARSPFIPRLLPHLLDNPNALTPAYHMKGPRGYTDVVIGIPTVKRDKESYLSATLKHLIDGMETDEVNKTVIVVLVGETVLKDVVDIAAQVETSFPEEVESGLIEVLAPSPSYYPDFDKLNPSLGDSMKRIQWRTKQNLDILYLMSYGRTRGAFYLMLEDDVVAKNSYMKEMLGFTVATSRVNPNWIVLEFCRIGGIGKLFKSTGLLQFIIFVQLFYTNMPIDWLLESYVANKICPIDKNSMACSNLKGTVRPRYETSLFQHIGVYSSLKGKIHRPIGDPLQDDIFGDVPQYFPHDNPKVDYIKVDQLERLDHCALNAYNGFNFFWAANPRAGEIVEFWFSKPTHLKRYLFRSGNVDHTSDKYYNTVVEVLPSHASDGNFTTIGAFDEFGLADGEVKGFDAIDAIRLRVLQNSTFWSILSEIHLQTDDKIEI